jgi:excisionase family DNA binding protein
MSDFMTAAEAAERLGVSVARVYQLARESRLPHIRRGRRLLIPKAAWQEWLTRQVQVALSAEQS